VKLPPAVVRALVAKGMMPAAAVPPETESDFQRRVIDLAGSLGWTCLHLPRVAMRRRGELVHLTATVGGRGYPDLTLFRDRVVYAELKAAGGRLRPEQAKWRDRIRAAGGEWHLWKPADWTDIVGVLT